jgi:hypothetical protein
MPVHDGHKIHEPTAHRNVGYVCRPYLVGTVYFKVSKQIRVYFLFPNKRTTLCIIHHRKFPNLDRAFLHIQDKYHG